MVSVVRDSASVIFVWCLFCTLSLALLLYQTQKTVAVAVESTHAQGWTSINVTTQPSTALHTCLVCAPQETFCDQWYTHPSVLSLSRATHGKRGISASFPLAVSAFPYDQLLLRFFGKLEVCDVCGHITSSSKRRHEKNWRYCTTSIRQLHSYGLSALCSRKDFFFLTTLFHCFTD